MFNLESSNPVESMDLAVDGDSSNKVNALQKIKKEQQQLQRVAR